MNIPGQGESTLPEGVVAEDENALPTVVNARTLAMQAIEQDNLRRLEEETGIKLVEDEPPVDESLQNQLQEPQPEPEPAPVTQPTTVKLKADGMEKEVTQEELIALAQKNLAADARLRRATEMLQEAEQLRQQMLAQPEENQITATTPDRDAVRGQVEAAVTKLFEGEQDAAVETLTELITKAGGQAPTQPVVQPQIDIDAVTNQVLERTAIQAAFNTVKTDYPDLVANPTLEKLAGMQIDELVEATGIPRSQAILTVAEQLYRDLGKTPVGRQAPAPDEPPPTNTRLENKQKLDHVPSASRAAALPVTPEEPNPSDVIAEMAARRLGQSLPQRTG